MKTTVFPAATMPMELQMIVEDGFVTGVIAPMTPNGAGSMRTRPWSPDAAVGVELLGARRLVRDEEVLLDLVLDAPEARLLDGERREGIARSARMASRIDSMIACRFSRPSASRAPERRRAAAATASSRFEKTPPPRPRRRRRPRAAPLPRTSSPRDDLGQAAIASAMTPDVSGLKPLHALRRRRSRARTSASRRASGRRSPRCRRSP